MSLWLYNYSLAASMWETFSRKSVKVQFCGQALYVAAADVLWCTVLSGTGYPHLCDVPVILQSNKAGSAP